MDKLIQILFNTNHEMPNGWVLLVLAGLAIVVPSIMRYVQGRKEDQKYSSIQKKSKKK